MTGGADAPETGHRSGRLAAGFGNPYVQIALGAVLVTASELLLKKGAASTAAAPGAAGAMGIGALASAWTWAGIVLYILATVSWLHVLRLMPLAIAFGLINVVHVLVPVAAWWLLHEGVSPRRWVGIGLILAGVIALARPAAKAEEGL